MPGLPHVGSSDSVLVVVTVVLRVAVTVVDVVHMVLVLHGFVAAIFAVLVIRNGVLSLRLVLIVVVAVLGVQVAIVLVVHVVAVLDSLVAAARAVGVFGRGVFSFVVSHGVLLLVCAPGCRG